MKPLTGDWLTQEATQTALTTLTGAGHKAFVVGGAVRDAILGRGVGDIDISTDARPVIVTAIFEKAGLKVVPTGIDHGTVTVVICGAPFEITTFRRDVATDGRRATVAFSADIADDAHRRDFTMNALYVASDGTVHDPLGQGLDDLDTRRVRFIDDAAARIREDYLRTLRFFRFHAWYGDAAAGLDPEALDAIARHLDGLAGLSKERIGHEMLRLLGAPDPGPSLAAMQATGVLGALLAGSDARGIAPLVHHEAGLGAAPDAIRRLAALGGEEVAQSLRLSRSQTQDLAVLREEIGSARAVAELGYRYGADRAVSAALLRAALLETPLPKNVRAEAERGAAAEFPISANDLMPSLTGPALGRALKKIEERWIASDFTSSRDQLLAE
ncbi:MAG: CCA tRNA nucleotidyltransferase [Rhodobacteraceae bacterium]|nr:CCA tRNA nucleotidyltransferase [Paracoccaceae bacterium]